MTSLIYLAGPPGLKIKRAIESTGLDLRYFQLDASRPCFERLRVLRRVIAATWQEREQAVGLMIDFIGGYSLAAMLVCWLTGVPFVIRLRGDIWHETREALHLARSFTRKIFHYRQLLLARFVVRHANLIIPTSIFLKERILAEVKVKDAAQERVIPVSEFLELDYFRPERVKPGARQILGLPEDARVICTVTNFSYQAKARGLYVIVTVLNPLMQADGRIHWLIAGSGLFQAEFVRTVMAQAQSKDNILFLGHCSDIKSIYLASDLLIHFSFMDAFPAVVLEAQACGLPVIVNHFGGMPEQVRPGETGYIVNPTEPMAVQHLIRHLLDDPEQRTRMGLAGRQWVESKFNYQAVGERFEQALALIRDSK